MFALETPLIARLQALPALAGWEVRSSAAEVSRAPVPAAEVRCEGAAPTDSRGATSLVAVLWGVRLVVKRDPGAMAQLDGVLHAVIASLHNWLPGTEGSRAWQRLQLHEVRPDFADEGLVEYAIVFKTSARYDGQP